jgi:23S rRNA (uracil1939-C5)-methyltransferase
MARPDHRRHPSHQARSQILTESPLLEDEATSRDVASGPILDLKITAVAYGGRGVARQTPTEDLAASPELPQDQPAEGTGKIEGHGKVWFVEGAVPGDRVRARVTADEGRYGEAQMVELLERSPLRTNPLCQFEHDCGGCQWMGIDYEQQLEWKKSFVESALKRIGKLGTDVPVQIVSSPSRYHYRNRILLRAHWLPASSEIDRAQAKGRLDVGYFARGSRRLVPITRCEIAAEGLNRILEEIRAFTFPEAGFFKARIEIQEILSHGDTQIVATVYPAEGPRESMDALALKLKGLPKVAWAGLVFDLPSAPLVDFDHDLNRDFLTIPGQFQQINMALNRTLRRLVKDKVEIEDAQRVLDVFCGSGNLSLPIADGQRYVEAVEFNKKAIFCADQNAERNKLSKLSFHAGDAEKHLWKAARAGERFDLVVLDPPRQGMYKGMEPLKMLAPKHIIYVSCDPTTLARDLGYLLRKDTYRIESVTALDFFPNTYHVETVVFLKRSANGQ